MPVADLIGRGHPTDKYVPDPWWRRAFFETLPPAIRFRGNFSNEQMAHFHSSSGFTMHLKVKTATGEISRDELWLANAEEIHSGDMLFTRNIYAANPVEAAQSRTIRIVTKGQFSHVAICTQRPVFIEAIGQGVSNLSLSRCFAFDRENIQVRRYRDPNIAGAAARYATTLLGQRYSLRRAVATMRPGVAAVVDRGTICSRLVWEAYVAGAAPEFTTLDGATVTPAILEKIAGFEDVTDAIFAKGRTPNNAEMMSALDGDRVPSPADVQTGLLVSYLHALEPQLEALAGLSPTFVVPRAFFQAVSTIGELLLVANTKGDDGDLTRMLHDIDATMMKSLSAGDLDATLDEAIQLERKDLERIEREALLDSPDIDIEQLEQAYSSTQAAIASRERTLPYLKEIGTASAAGAWFYRFQIRVTESTKERLQRQRAVLRELGRL